MQCQLFAHARAPAAAQRAGARLGGARGVAASRRAPSRAGRLACAASVTGVNVTKAAELLKSGTKYLDVRTTGEFQDGHPTGALHVEWATRGAMGMSPNPRFLADVAQVLPDKAAPLLVACKAGSRSAAAAAALAAAGYTNLLDVQGGFDAWAAAKLPVSK